MSHHTSGTAPAKAIAARVASLLLIVAAMSIANWSETSWSKPQPAPAAADPQRSIDIDEGTIRRFTADLGEMGPAFQAYFFDVRRCLSVSSSSKTEQCLDSAHEAARCGPNMSACAHVDGQVWEMYISHYEKILSRDRRLGNLAAEEQAKWRAYQATRCGLRSHLNLITAVPYLSFHAESCLGGMAKERAMDLHYVIESLKFEEPSRANRHQ